MKNKIGITIVVVAGLLLGVQAACADAMLCSGEQKTCISNCQKGTNPTLIGNCIANCRARLSACVAGRGWAAGRGLPRPGPDHGVHHHRDPCDIGYRDSVVRHPGTRRALAPRGLPGLPQWPGATALSPHPRGVTRCYRKVCRRGWRGWQTNRDAAGAGGNTNMTCSDASLKG